MKTALVIVGICVLLFGLFKILTITKEGSQFWTPENLQFEVIHSEWINGARIVIYRDKKMDQSYLWIKDGFGAGLTAMPK